MRLTTFTTYQTCERFATRVWSTKLALEFSEGATSSREECIQEWLLHPRRRKNISEYRGNPTTFMAFRWRPEPGNPTQQRLKVSWIHNMDFHVYNMCSCCPSWYPSSLPRPSSRLTQMKQFSVGRSFEEDRCLNTITWFLVSFTLIFQLPVRGGCLEKRLLEQLGLWQCTC